MTPVDQRRAKDLERSQALAAVINLRIDLAHLEQKLAFAGASPRQYGQAHFDRLQGLIADGQAKLNAAVEFCMKVAPDLLTDHDEQAAAAEQAKKDQRVAQEALYEAERLAALAKSDEAARRRLEARQRADAEA